MVRFQMCGHVLLNVFACCLLNVCLMFKHALDVCININRMVLTRKTRFKQYLVIEKIGVRRPGGTAGVPSVSCWWPAASVSCRSPITGVCIN